MADNRTMQSDDPPEPAPAAMAARVEGAAKLVVRGADATSFLHGQLANDVSGMPVGTARRSLYLSHKGHALAEVMVMRHGRNDYELVEEGGAVSWVKAELERHVVFDDVAVEGPTPVGLVTVQGEGAAHVLARALGVEAPVGEAVASSREGSAYRRRRSEAGGYDVLWGEPAELLPTLASAGARVAAPEDIALLRVRALIAHVPQDAGEGVLPQEAGLEDALSYRKGCYLGQEIMARIEARGNVRRTLRRLRLERRPSGEGVAPGRAEDGAARADAWREVRAGERVVGRLGTVAPAPEGGWEALAVLRMDLPDGAELTAGGVPARLA